ncbi:hypothetical protein D3C72_868160 [compost metagenome]
MGVDRQRGRHLVSCPQAHLGEDGRSAAIDLPAARHLAQHVPAVADRPVVPGHQPQVDGADAHGHVSNDDAWLHRQTSGTDRGLDGPTGLQPPGRLAGKTQVALEVGRMAPWAVPEGSQVMLVAQAEPGGVPRGQQGKRAHHARHGPVPDGMADVQGPFAGPHAAPVSQAEQQGHGPAGADGDGVLPVRQHARGLTSQEVRGLGRLRKRTRDREAQGERRPRQRG